MVLFLVCSITWSSAYSSVLKMFGYLGSLEAILIYGGMLSILAPTNKLPIPWLPRGVNEPLVYVIE